MRDAFGGVFMMRLFLVFIVVYVGFGAISFNYAKSFKVKNKVIDLIELNQVQPKNIAAFISDEKIQKKLDNIVEEATYNYQCADNKSNLLQDKDTKNVIGFCYRGIVVEKEEVNESNHVQTYIVKVYNSWNLGLFDSFLALIGKDKKESYEVNGTWEITGEAKVHTR